METYESYELDSDHVGDNKYYLIDGMNVMLTFFEGAVLDVTLPDRVTLTVVETTPAIKGAPSTQTKDGKTETGLTLRIPQFIEEGEKILVSTADGKYSGRA
jgi:elongation factor P